MKKIIDYQVLHSSISRSVSDSVNVYLKAGYELYGSISTVMGPDGMIYCSQAVVKYDISEAD